MLVTKTTLDAKAISEEVTSRFDTAVVKYENSFLKVAEQYVDKFDLDDLYLDDLSNLILAITADVINDINNGDLI